MQVNRLFFTEIREVRFSDDGDWHTDRIDFRRYCLLRINNEFMIVALLDNDDADIEGFLIPTGDGGIVLSTGKHYLSEHRSLPVPHPDHHFQSKDFYRIKREEGAHVLCDHLFKERLLGQSYDSITVSNMIIVGRLNDHVDLFNVLLDPIEISEPLAAIAIDMKVQILTRRGILWYTPDGILHDTMPIIRHGICGNYSSVTRNIANENGMFYEIRQLSGLGFYNTTDSTALPLRRDIIGLKYLDGSDTHYYDEYSHLGRVYSIPYNYYIFETKISKGILKINSNADSIVRAYSNRFPLEMPFQQRMDSIARLARSTPPTITSEILFERPEVEFFPCHYNEPIKFRIGTLFGYFPNDREARYRRLGNFNLAFAEYKKPDGTKGWVDVAGNEYQRKD
jgi:hypothetical protein